MKSGRRQFRCILDAALISFSIIPEEFSEGSLPEILIALYQAGAEYCTLIALFNNSYQDQFRGRVR